MQGSDIPAAGEETTVEDLLRVVKQLPSEAEAAPVCFFAAVYIVNKRRFNSLLQ